MLFNTFLFWRFFAVVLCLYVALNHRWQNRMLLLASILFYACWDESFGWLDPRHYRFVLVMLGTAGLDYFIGNKLAQLKEPRARKRWLVFSIVMNLGVLGFFKYFNFCVQNVHDAARLLGLDIPTFELQIILPVGISFYTFQSMAYTIDIYRGELEPARSLRDFLLFIAYFPHLVAGPINRPKSLLSQCERPRRLNWEVCCDGVLLILIGLFKKVCVADLLAPIAMRTFANPRECSAGTLLFGLYCFSFRIYTDFSGYTDIARGLAKLMGFELIENFKHPYFSANVTEFWRRWHISLSTWLRDYLYVPLGGNRHGELNTYRNLFLTMFLGGLWHGASWNYAVWGSLHGIYLAVHKLMIAKKKLAEVPPKNNSTEVALYLIKVLVTFHLVALAWVFFNEQPFHDSLDYIYGIVSLRSAGTVRLPPDSVGYALWSMATLILFIDIPQYARREACTILRWSMAPKVAVLTMLALWLIMSRETENVPFIYFKF